MAPDSPANAPLTGDWALQILRSSMGSNPYRHPGNWSPIEEMLGSAPTLDLLRQALPEKLGSTAAGQQLFELIAGDSPVDSWRRKAGGALNSLPLGGYSRQHMEALDEERAYDPLKRFNSQKLGVVPDVTGLNEVSTKGRPDLAALQVAGTTAGDLMSDGLRNVWWFLNAPQALTTLAVLEAANRGGANRFREEAGIDYGPLLKNPRLRFAAAAPAWMAMSAAVGSGVRQPGYAAVVPSEEDRTQTADPVAEVLSRFFLGRSGALLPYDEFVKERPDVSRGEYEAYKAYLFENKSPLKFTGDGIHGPEVTFMGKSIPLATGVLPAAAGVLGAGFGVRRAAQRLSSQGALATAKQHNQQAMRAEGKLRDLERELTRNAGKDPQATAIAENLHLRKYDSLPQEWKDLKAVVDVAKSRQLARERLNDYELLKDALLYSSGGLVGASILGSGLESLRRGMPDTRPTEAQSGELASTR